MIKKFFKILLFFPPVIGAVLVLQYIVDQKKPPARLPVAEYSQHVRIITAVRTPLVPRILGYGTAQPSRVWKAVAQVSGKIDYIHPEFKKGALLKAGTVVIRIATDDYMLAIRQAEANIRAGNAKLKELEVSQANTQNSLQIEQRTLEINNRELARKRKLLKRKTIAQSTIDQETRANLAQKQKVLGLENSLKLIPTQRIAQVEQIAVYKSQLETARLNLARTSLRLPFDALVAEQDVEVTQFVNVGQTLGSADSIKRMEVDAQVASSKFLAMARAMIGENRITGINKDTLKQAVKTFGIRALVRMQNNDEEIFWEGKVERISDSIDPKTRTLGILITVDDSYSKAIPGYLPPLMKGSFVEVEIVAKARNTVISIPRSALHEGKVFIANKESRLEIRKVTPLLHQANHVVLADGIKEGEDVVISPLNPAIEGSLLVTTVDRPAMAQLHAETSGKGELK